MKLTLISTIFILSIYACQETRFHEGKRLYLAYCANCHMDDGEGLAKLYPPLKEADYLSNNLNKLPEIIKYGISDSLIVNGIQYTIPMSGLEELNMVQISNIYNYILSVWYPNQKPLNFEEIENKILNFRNYD